MKKQTFFRLVLGVVGGLLFSLGLCMCLLPEWNAFQPGVICTGLGLVFLLVLLLRTLGGRKKLSPNWKLIGKIAFGILGTLVFGLGMCLMLVWQQLWGIAVGIGGIVMLLCLIPMFLGLK